MGIDPGRKPQRIHVRIYHETSRSLEFHVTDFELQGRSVVGAFDRKQTTFRCGACESLMRGGRASATCSSLREIHPLLFRPHPEVAASPGIASFEKRRDGEIVPGEGVNIAGSDGRPESDGLAHHEPESRLPIARSCPAA